MVGRLLAWVVAVPFRPEDEEAKRAGRARQRRASVGVPLEPRRGRQCAALATSHAATPGPLGLAGLQRDQGCLCPSELRWAWAPGLEPPSRGLELAVATARLLAMASVPAARPSPL